MSGNPDTEAFWDAGGQRQKRGRSRRLTITVAAGTAAVGMVAGVAYAVSGSSNPQGRPVAASSAVPSTRPMAPDAVQHQPIKSTPHRAPKKHKHKHKKKHHHPSHKPPMPGGSGGSTGGSSGGSTGGSTGGGGAPSGGGGKTGTYAQQVLQLTNVERGKNGCGPLTLDLKLQRAAQLHSEDMATRNFFDHTNPSGQNPGQRVTAAGYVWSTVGENIAAGQPTPSAVVTGWMNSPGHRANILNCAFKNLGVGVANHPGSQYTMYWTQDFGTKR